MQHSQVTQPEKTVTKCVVVLSIESSKLIVQLFEKQSEFV